MPVDQELSALATVASLLPTDIIYIVRDPGGVAEADHKAAVSVLDARYPGAVISVFGRTGAVVAASGDYSAGQISGLGTLAVLNSPLPIVNGGSGQITQQAAIDALSNVTAATNEHVLTKDTASGNVIFKAAAGGSSLPVADTQTIVKGSADATKLLRFEVDGFTAGATRVLTPPNQDTLLSGQNFLNVFTVAQAIILNSTALPTIDSEIAYAFKILDTAAIAGKYFYNAQANGYAEFSFVNDGGDSTHAFAIGIGGTTVASTAYTNSGYIATNSALDHLLIQATKSNGYIRFDAGGANNEMMRLTPAGLAIGETAPDSLLYVRKTDAVTNSVVDILDIVHSLSNGNSAAAGFGSAIYFAGEDSTSDYIDMGRLTYKWGVATHASREVIGTLSAFYVTTERECIQWRANTTGPMLGFYGSASVNKQTVTGSRGANAALASLLTALATIGLITDSSS